MPSKKNTSILRIDLGSRSSCINAILISLLLSLGGCASTQTQAPQGADNQDLYQGESSLLYQSKIKDLSTEQLNKQADQALHSGNTDKAVYFYVHSLSIDGEQHKIYTRIGNIHYHRGNYSLATMAFERALALSPEHLPSLMGLGRTHLSQKNRQTAKTLLVKAAKIDQARVQIQTISNATASVNAGPSTETKAGSTTERNTAPASISSTSEKPSSTIDSAEQAEKTIPSQQSLLTETEGTLEVKPEDSTWQVDANSPFPVYNSLGVIADLDKEFSLAQNYYQLAIRIQPNNPSPYNNLAYSYYLDRDWRNAESAFLKTLNIDNSFTQAWRNLGLLYTREGKYYQALNTFSKLMTEAEAYNTVGYLCMQEKAYSKAEGFFKKAIDLSPAYYLMARENLKQNRQLLEQETMTKQ